VCSLIHDIGDTLTPLNHADLGAAIVKSWVPEPYHWMVKHHDIFQGYYFWHHIGLDRNARDALKSHEYYEVGKEFVDKYDMLAFDPDYPTPPLAHYETLLRGFFVEPAQG
jgi:predicted HD phosphohydrolase